jgi:hypothetical protein
MGSEHRLRGGIRAEVRRYTVDVSADALRKRVSCQTRVSTRQLNRVCHMEAELAGLPKWVARYTLQHSFVYGLLCSVDGCPVAIEEFERNTGDPPRVGNQITKLKEGFGLTRVVMVGDRGIITQAHTIADDLKPAGIDWITALRPPAIQQLAAEGGPLQLSFFRRARSRRDRKQGVVSRRAPLRLQELRSRR